MNNIVYKLNRGIYDELMELMIPTGTVVEVESFQPANKTITFKYSEQTVTCPQDWLDSVEEKEEKSYAQQRKERPVYSGVLKYFPNALKEVAHCSFVGNEQHNPGSELHWDRTKSQDNPDACVRHLIDHTIDPMDDDGVYHLAKACWRALATFEKYLEDERGTDK